MLQTKVTKFGKAFDERGRGNVNKLKEGPRQNSENYQARTTKITKTPKVCKAFDEK